MHVSDSNQSCGPCGFPVASRDDRQSLPMQRLLGLEQSPFSVAKERDVPSLPMHRLIGLHQVKPNDKLEKATTKCRAISSTKKKRQSS
eukprot:CAMPEP_0202509074 /NCGR_PEP_ID=MMETSP1361-20130828/52579_1 /ASSEMBLY_ACC=CAM_ASM_000849 /TAXON_ID=210615 /ORGANISM="Staurosira complex sp., Strain CCMP2646" /LENGTH=87 /DNA_ID=CAMNT_0049143271 /DNA_START=888 /DNA_END=1148 /DNA_ORIENTATION=-